MAVDERSRKRMHDALERRIGADEAATLMEHLPPVGWTDVATKRDLDALAVATKRDLDALAVATKRDLDAMADRLRAEMDHGLRQVIQWNVGTVIAMTGLAFAAGRFV